MANDEDNKDPSIGINIPKEFSFEYVINKFILQITSLSTTMPLTMAAINLAYKDTEKKYKTFEKDYIRQVEHDGKKYRLVRTDHYQEFKMLVKELGSQGIALSIIPQSFLVSLVSLFDDYFGQLVKTVYLIKPELLNASERTIPFSLLAQFSSISEGRDYILEKEVDSLLRDSHADQFKWMENKYKMTLRKDLDVWPEFIEITERRNLFVHTGGTVTNQYINTCTEHNVYLDEKPQSGIILDVDPNYFESAFRIFFEIGVKLAHVLWRKFKPDELEKADENLNSIGYDLLCEENYSLAKVIFDFPILTMKKYYNDERKRIFIINRAQTYKWLGDNNKCREIISGEDWSSSGNKFQLAQAVLINDFPKALKLVKKIGNNQEELTMEQYRDWPLFKELRLINDFLRLFEELFGEPLNTVDSSINMDDSVKQ